MRTSRVLSAAAAVALLVGVAAPVAHAYDREAYEYAAGHMLDRSDIPKNLGSFDPVLRFNAGPGYKSSLCYVPSGEEGNPGTDIFMAKGQRQYTGSYDTGKDDGVNVTVQVTEYASATAAIKAFEGVKKQAKKCTGTGSSTYTSDDGTVYTSSWNVSNAAVPMVTVVGVESISITQDNLSTNSTSDEAYLNDNYSVYSLVDDAILETTYYSNSTKSMTEAQRKSVNQVAFDAVGRWVG